MSAVRKMASVFFTRAAASWLRFAAQPGGASRALRGSDAIDIGEAELILRLPAERDLDLARAFASNGAQLHGVAHAQLAQALVEVRGQRFAVDGDDLVALLEPCLGGLAALFDEHDDGRLVEVPDGR